MTEPKSIHEGRRDVTSAVSEESRATDSLSRETFQNPEEFLRILRLGALPIAGALLVKTLDRNEQNRDLAAQTESIAKGAGAFNTLDLGAAQTAGRGLANGLQSEPGDTDKLPKHGQESKNIGISKGAKTFKVVDLGAAEGLGSSLGASRGSGGDFGAAGKLSRYVLPVLPLLTIYAVRELNKQLDR